MTTNMRVMLGGTDQTVVARQALNELFRTEGGRQGLWVVGQDFWGWSGERWAMRQKSEIERMVIEWLEDALIPQGDNADGQPIFGRATDKLSARDVREIVWMVERMCQAPVSTMPRWLEPGNWPDPDHCIPFQNVVVDIKKTAELRKAGQTGYITLPRDDRFFGAGVLSVNFDPDAPCPTWIKAQEDWSMGDKVWQEVRERAYGYACMATRKEGKALLEQGKTQSGKGSGTNDVLSKLLARPAYYSTTMDQIVDTFGMDGLHQSQVWVTSEVRDLDRGAGSKFATILKMVLGRDAAVVNIKHVRQLKGVVFRCFPIMQSNPMPNFPDDAGAVTSKLIVLPFRNSFADRRDNDLPEKLGSELTGIAARFADAAVRLEMATGHDSWPLVEGAAEILNEIALNGNPFDAFMKWGFVKSSNGIVSADYINVKRMEFEAETGVILRKKDGKKVPESQLLYFLETQTNWKVGRKVLRDGTTGLTGIGMKGIA